MATPDTKSAPPNVDATTLVKTGIVHDSEAIAYEIPNRNIDQRPRSCPPRSRWGSLRIGSQPSANAMPMTIRTMPITTVIHAE